MCVSVGEQRVRYAQPEGTGDELEEAIAEALRLDGLEGSDDEAYFGRDENDDGIESLNRDRLGEILRRLERHGRAINAWVSDARGLTQVVRSIPPAGPSRTLGKAVVALAALSAKYQTAAEELSQSLNALLAQIGLPPFPPGKIQPFDVVQRGRMIAFGTDEPKAIEA